MVPVQYDLTNHKKQLFIVQLLKGYFNNNNNALDIDLEHLYFSKDNSDCLSQIIVRHRLHLM